MRLDQAARWLDLGLVPRITVGSEGATLWDGRLEDVTVGRDGLSLAAMGYWRSLSDRPYTSLFSESRFDAFELAVPLLSTANAPEKFEMDKQGRLYIAPRKDETAGSSFVGGWTYQTPDQSAYGIQRIVFTYKLKAGVNWNAQVLMSNRDGSNPMSAWALGGNGGTQTGTITLTPSGAYPRVTFRFYYQGFPGLYGQDTGDHFFEVTAVRLMNQNTPTITARDALMAALLAAVTGNSGQLSSSASLIETPNRDISQLVVEDMTALELADALEESTNTALGTQAPWSYYVYEDRILQFSPWPKASKTYYADLADLELTRSLAEYASEVYALYQDATGTAKRTLTQADSAAASRYGLSRRSAVYSGANLDNSAVVDATRHLAQRAASPPRVRVEIEALHTAEGQRVPLWALRAGDALIIRSLVPLDPILVGETTYSADNDRLQIEAEFAQPSLERLASSSGRRFGPLRRSRGDGDWYERPYQ